MDYTCKVKYFGEHDSKLIRGSVYIAEFNQGNSIASIRTAEGTYVEHALINDLYFLREDMRRLGYGLSDEPYTITPAHYRILDGIDFAAPEESTGDAVRQPSHYQLFDGIESIEVIARSMTAEQFWGFCCGNVLKYRLRAGKKSDLANIEQDLKKADFYNELYAKHVGECREAK